MLNKSKKERTTKVKKEKNTNVQTETKPVKKETKITEQESKEIVDIAPTPTIATEKTSNVTKVGTLLKSMRTEKGIKIVDVAKKLCIRRQYLEAIEDSDYKEIPAFPYGIGFIRSYADFLGLNSGNIVELYKEETNFNKSVNVDIVEPQVKPAVPSGIYVLISLLALGILYGAWTLLSNSDSEDEQITEEQLDENNDVIVIEELAIPQTEENETTKFEEITPVADEQITVSEDVYQESSAEQKKEDISHISQIDSDESASKSIKSVAIPSHGIYVEVLEETWIEVKNESKLYISKVLNPGENYMLPNDKGLILSVGKRDGVNVYVDGVKTDIAHTGKKMNIDIDSYLSENH